MDIGTVLTILGTVADVSAIASAIKDWVVSSSSNSDSVNKINAVLGQLPESASPDQIIAALSPMYLARSGSVSVSAGDNGGGDITLTNPTIASGSAPGGSGDVVIKSGVGGPHGTGGNFTMTGGVIKTGDVK